MFYLIMELPNLLYWDFSYKLNLKAEPLKEQLQVEIDNREIILVSQVYPNCDLKLAGRYFHVDLIPFTLEEFDVILGMDWLSSNDAQIDCGGKQIKLKISGEKDVVFKGQRQTKKHLSMAHPKIVMKGR